MRGLHSVVLANGKSYVTLTVNLSVDNEPVAFRLWNPDDRMEHPINGTLNLMIGGLYGTGKLVVLESKGHEGVNRVRLLEVNRVPFGFGFDTETGGVYRVESSSDLKAWHPAGEIKGTGARARFIEPVEGRAQKRFYRVRLESHP